MEFKELGVIADIEKALSEVGIENPTPIQEKTIPLVIKGKDIIAGSATGSGKTLAFGAGLLQNTEKKGVIQALILTPTRELAEQITTNLRLYSKYKKLKIYSIYGGVSINPQIDVLRSADVVVGTPGRILDHMGRRTINLRNVKTVVLDEADRMFEMGFLEDVEQIISATPKERQTLLFSATITKEVVELSSKHMKNPVEIEGEKQVDPRKLRQEYYDTPDNKKLSLLVQLIKNNKGVSMVFCNTKHATDFVARNLKLNGVNAIAIHGGYTQAKRSNTLKLFHAKKVNVLICTDVASRGLDIKGVTHVYNYDIPKESKQYIHRIGRTARAGEEGKAISLLTSRDYDNFRRVLREGVEIISVETPQLERIKIQRPESNQNSYRGRSSHSEYRGGQNEYRRRY